MMQFKENDKLHDLIDQDYHLLPVLNRFGIKLGIRDKTIAEICREQKINPSFFLAIVNTFHNKAYFPKEELLTCAPKEIVLYLQQTHQYYFRYIVPKLDHLLEQMIQSSTPGFQGLRMVDTFYKKYKKELQQHIDFEEEQVFPYVLKLISSGAPDPEFTIRSFEKEHSNVEEKLNDLRNLIIKYIEPEYDENACNEFLLTLALFEKDLEDHGRIEDKILIPLVLEIEKRSKNRNSTGPES